MGVGDAIRQAGKTFIFVIAPLILVAAVIESFVTPLLATIFIM
ncbi:putative membrane protein SpoIIM required for sporulation [Desulfitispora alkaliphila]